MTRLIGIASSKGGVGKTTLAINLTCALAQQGLDAVVVDASLDTPNVSLHLGSPKVRATLHSVLAGTHQPHDALYVHSPSGTKLVPGDLSVNHTLSGKHLLGLKRHLGGLAHVAIIDTASGLGDAALGALRSCNETIVVTTPDMPSVIDTLKTVRAARELGVHVRGAIINRSRDDGHDLESENVSTLLGVPVIAVIPDDDAVRDSLRMKHPVVYSHPDAPASIALSNCARSLIKYG